MENHEQKFVFLQIEQQFRPKLDFFKEFRSSFKKNYEFLNEMKVRIRILKRRILVNIEIEKIKFLHDFEDGVVP